MTEPLSLVLGLDSLEDVYVRGRTVHLVDSGHRFYGNIECESAADVRVGEVHAAAQSVLQGAGDSSWHQTEWELGLEILADSEMGRKGRECILLRFTDKSRAGGRPRGFPSGGCVCAFGPAESALTSGQHPGRTLAPVIRAVFWPPPGLHYSLVPRRLP